MKTATYLDSRPASPASIKGSFHKDSNVFSFNLFMEVAMLKEGNKLVQAARFNKEVMQKQPFDIVIGSGRKGQSFLYWKGNQLFQLPISYFTATNSWTNSPGFPAYPYFERPVPLNCLECHSICPLYPSDAAHQLTRCVICSLRPRNHHKQQTTL